MTIAQAKEVLPLKQLMELLGDESSARNSAPCPFHPDKNPSFSVFQWPDGRWWFKCHAGCGTGDEITYLEMKLELPRREAIRKYLWLAEGGWE